ncbi:MAG: biopolymer transporter ExbD [Balneolales bacterium]
MTFREEGERKPPLSLFSASSLTDIVLLLLIFFLLTSTFVTNSAIQIEMPKAETGSATEQQFLNVTVTNDGSFYVMGSPVSTANLASSIRDEQQKNPNVSLVLRADKNAIIDDAVNVMNIAKALNMNIMMATERASR